MDAMLITMAGRSSLAPAGLLNQRTASGHGRHVLWQRDAGAARRRKLRGGGIAGFPLARGDVDLRTVLEEAFAIILPMPREPPVTSAIGFRAKKVTSSWR